ncbi:VWA domain-containing protein [Candidatus Acetothermia bacterium]|nr:VWA domain-containing protein [Candidatus Acetothermia bacterium]
MFREGFPSCLGILVLVFGLLAIAGMVVSAQEIQIEQNIDPTTVFIKSGTQDPKIATVKLTLKAVPAPDKPVDMFILFDRSASQDLRMLKMVARQIVSQLSAGDRVGIISFSEAAEVNLPLTNDLNKAYSTIDSLTQGKQTAMGEALAMATDELVKEVRPNALRAIIVPTDGISPVGRRAELEAQRAGMQQLAIYPFGISKNVNRKFLSELAKYSKGTFFVRYNVESLEGLFKKLGRATAARFVHVVATISPGVNLETFFDTPQLRRGADGLLKAEWDFDLMMTGAVRSFAFQLSVNRTGTISVIQKPSFVEFTNSKGDKTSQDLAPMSIEAKKEIKPPVADFVYAPDRPKVNDLATFDASASKDPDGKIVRYEWDWDGDGTFDETLTSSKVTHTFTTGGDRKVVLKVTDDDNATAQAEKTVSVEGLPSTSNNLPAQIKASPANPQAGESVSFDAAALGNFVKYEWDWDSDGTFDETVTTLTITHIFKDAGTFKVTLRVTDANGQTQMFTFTFVVASRTTTTGTSFDASKVATGDLQGEVQSPGWIDYYTRDGKVTDDELRDAATRYGIGVYVPGTRYLLNQKDLEILNQLNQMTKAIAKYQDVDQAKSDGYKEVGAAVAQVGQLYVNQSLVSGAVSVTRVPFLIYTPGSDGKLKLIGVRFVALNSGDANLFGITNWPTVGGIYVLTVWLSPNPKGTFANINPNVK